MYFVASRVINYINFALNARDTFEKGKKCGNKKLLTISNNRQMNQLCDKLNNTSYFLSSTNKTASQTSKLKLCTFHV